MSENHCWTGFRYVSVTSLALGGFGRVLRARL